MRFITMLVRVGYFRRLGCDSMRFITMLVRVVGL